MSIFHKKTFFLPIHVLDTAHNGAKFAAVLTKQSDTVFITSINTYYMLLTKTSARH